MGAASRHIARTLLLGRRETHEQVLNMFESKEEVERTMLALKIFPDIGQVGDVEQEEPDTDEEEYAPQVFPEHTESETRYTRSLYYGFLPATDRPSLPLTRLAVDQFLHDDGEEDEVFNDEWASSAGIDTK